MWAVLRYTGARAVLFGVALGVLYALGARQVLLLALAIVVSGLISYPLLSGQRDEMSRVLSERIGEFRERLETGAAAEDAAAEQAAADQGAADQAAARRDPGQPSPGQPEFGRPEPPRPDRGRPAPESSAEVEPGLGGSPTRRG